MYNPTLTRAYTLGLGYGSIWLVASSTAFGILDMVNVTTSLVAMVISILGVVLIGGGLIFLCITFLRVASTLPKTGQGKISRAKRGIFLLLILAELVGWSILNISLGMSGNTVWIVPADLIIIAAHFLPLAYVFKVPAYLVMGILWIVLIMVSIVLIPSTTIIGHVSAWTTIPSIGCIITTWLTVLYLMMTVGRNVRLKAQTAF